MDERIVIISGDAPLPDHVVAAIPGEAILLAVDSGLDRARDAGLTPSGLIGDLDSVSEEGLEWAQGHATIARHPTDKDATDTELALAFAAAMHPAQLTLVGGGDRLDHTIAALGALGAPQLTSIPVLDGWWDGQHVRVLHGPGRTTLRLVPGSRLSLLALHGRCGKVSISGVKWELDDQELLAAVGRGVSNEVLDGDGQAIDGVAEVTISLSTGVLTVFDDPVQEEEDDTP